MSVVVKAPMCNNPEQTHNIRFQCTKVYSVLGNASFLTRNKHAVTEIRIGALDLYICSRSVAKYVLKHLDQYDRNSIFIRCLAMESYIFLSTGVLLED